jgi:hypothetical protein
MCSPLDSGGLTGNLDDSWFPAKQASDGVLTEEPGLRQLGNAVMAFQGRWGEAILWSFGSYRNIHLLLCGFH